jgi:hypothetical protein
MTRFGRAILAIYASLHKSHIHIGTCTAIRLDGKQYLVTAGHVFDEHQCGQLWVGGEEKLVQLSGRYFASQPPGGDRKHDHYDFAVIEVGPELAKQLGDVVYIGPEHISANRRQAEKKVLYLCVGYPNSKNKDIYAARREMKAEFWNHVAPGHLTHDGLDPWAKSTSDHLFIDLPKRHAKNAEGKTINAVHPKGASGGPVFYMGDFADCDTYYAERECHPILEAIIIEGNPNARALVALVIQKLIGALRDESTVAIPRA